MCSTLAEAAYPETAGSPEAGKGTAE
jgi:hypothetical protein